MSSKLLGVLNSVSQQITIERTDVASGPHTITLDDGPYFAASRGVGRVAAGSVGTTVSFTAAHAFEVDDVLIGWDSSGPDVQLFIDTVTAVGPTQVQFANAHTVVIDDALFVSGDLVGYITARIWAQDVANLVTMVASVSSGIWSFGATVGNYTITWPTATLQEWLRYSGTVTIVTTTETPNPDQQMVGMLWLGKDVQRDDLSLEPFASQSRTVTGVVETFYRSQLQNRNLKLRTTGPLRSSLKNVSNAGKSFWSSHLAQGLRWRYYVDTGELLPFVEFANPRGYEVMVAPTDQFKPKPMQGGNDNNLDWAFRAHEYIAG